MSTNEISARQINLVLAWCEANTTVCKVKYSKPSGRVLTDLNWKTFELGEIGTAIATTNMKAIATSRCEDVQPHNYIFRELAAEARKMSGIQCLKYLECIRYNCDNAPDYQGSDAQYFIEHLNLATIRTLPGYENSKWSIE